MEVVKGGHVRGGGQVGRSKQVGHCGRVVKLNMSPEWERDMIHIYCAAQHKGEGALHYLASLLSRAQLPHMTQISLPHAQRDSRAWLWQADTAYCAARIYQCRLHPLGEWPSRGQKHVAAQREGCMCIEDNDFHCLGRWPPHHGCHCFGQRVSKKWICCLKISLPAD